MLFATASFAGTTGGWYFTILQCSVIAYRKKLSLNNLLFLPRRHTEEKKRFFLLRVPPWQTTICWITSKCVRYLWTTPKIIFLTAIGWRMSLMEK